MGIGCYGSVFGEMPTFDSDLIFSTTWLRAVLAPFLLLWWKTKPKQTNKKPTEEKGFGFVLAQSSRLQFFPARKSRWQEHK